MKASEPRRQPAQTTLANPLAARARTYGGKRVACALIGLALLLRPGVAAAWTGDPWGPLSRAAIQATADLMIDSTWTPKNTITNWEYGSTYHTFTKGVTYTGVAYSQHNPQENWTEFYNYVTSTSGGTTYYGNDCSGFASICWRLPARKTTYLFESQLGTYWISLGEKGSAATAPLLLSDALNSESDHIVLFLRRDPAGVATMEQTPYHAQRKVRSYSALSSYRPIRRLAITDAPALTQAGLSRVVDEGEAVSLSVSASGTEPLSYRWRFNGAPLAGATTSQLTFPAAQLTNAGN
ncbi:MAG: immunoglobulin domain-containing protein, partial [Verrucomicrobiota bacterium]|nr:immunoglobulin domain-containing protein [Verrucomicrobiota bacterium]